MSHLSYVLLKSLICGGEKTLYGNGELPSAREPTVTLFFPLVIKITVHEFHLTRAVQEHNFCVGRGSTVNIYSTGFQKRVLQLILDVREEVRETKSEVRDLKSIHCFTSFSDNNGLDLTIRHNNTLEELQEVENELENPTYYQEMFNKCVRIGGMNKKDMVSKLLSSFMTKNLMCKYNMYGQRAKLPFKNTKLFCVIRDSVLKKSPESCAADVTHIIATKLRNAPKLKETRVNS